MSIYGQIIILLACYRVVITDICQFGTGHGGYTQKARPAEVLTQSQGNLEAKGQNNQYRTNNYTYVYAQMKCTITNIHTLKSTPLTIHHKTIFLF